MPLSHRPLHRHRRCNHHELHCPYHLAENHGIVMSTAGSNYFVRVLSTLDREKLKPNASVALHRHSHSVVDILPPEADSTIQLVTEKPDVKYSDIGGMDIQKQEVREAVELPLTQFQLYKQIGIDPPRGVLMWGPPGTGKTMMAKAVANATSASFISMVGSEFVQKYLGEGPRMVRDVFRLAQENAPSIIFIDEVDAIATKRFDAQTGADREVQRILLELLNQMDGFDQSVNVKVIMATNRADTLDPALLRPGRLDRKIEFPNPDRRQKRMVLQACWFVRAIPRQKRCPQKQCNYPATATRHHIINTTYHNATLRITQRNATHHITHKQHLQIKLDNERG
mmetsp:Transcript_71693/g.202713  ORF Transcript_71693/g.202713 Transcript_71693/m.202713 type:complete len:340 (+) Transcript_71693:353-1372(+)